MEKFLHSNDREFEADGVSLRFSKKWGKAREIFVFKNGSIVAIDEDGNQIIEMQKLNLLDLLETLCVDQEDE